MSTLYDWIEGSRHKRYQTDSPFLLQTLNSISAEKNSTIIFPLPIDFITHFMKDGSTPKGEKED